jgi:putative endonuclease
LEDQIYENHQTSYSSTTKLQRVYLYVDLTKQMAQHNQLGEKGETLAVALLRKKGYSVLAANWRSGKNELDIVARIGDTMVFVEVKTRATDFFGEPSKAVSRAKQKRTIEAANQYLQKHELDLEARFDVVSIVTFGSKTKIEHIEDAFFPIA